MSNPYEMRFSMLSQAQALLTEQYHSEVNDLKEKYYAEKDVDPEVAFPELPHFPTFADIEKLATEMNEFVSKR